VRPKLLLADDSVTIQRVIELTFADEDVDVVAVGDGQQAIDRVRTERPDIVLADVGMPERDGYEVAAFIKGDPDLAHIPVLLLTGAFEPIDEARARAVGCDGVLVKPFEPQMVISRVRDLLAGKRDGPTGSAAHAEAAPAAAPIDAGGSLEDYFDRLDAALASKGGPMPSLDPVAPAPPPATVASKPHLTVAPAVVAVRPSPHADLDLTGWNPSAPEPLKSAAPSAPIKQHQPPAPSPPPAVVHEQPAVQPKPTVPAPQPLLAPVPPASPVNPVNPASPVSLDQAFAALLAAEQGQALPPPGHAEPAPRGWPETVPEAVIDAVVGKVIARMGDETMRAAVLDAAERLVREEIDRIKNAR
jgi:CheY-like chemotaxis protein